MPAPDDPLDRLHRDLGLKRLNPLWAKLEIALGLVAIGVGVVSAVRGTPHPDDLVWTWGGPVALIALGGYLALAGHRSHLYQSNNRLAAHLAELVRSQQPSEKAP